MRNQLLIFFLSLPTMLMAQNKLKGKTYELTYDTLKSNLRFCDSLVKPQYQQIQNLIIDIRFIAIDSLKGKIDGDDKVDYIYIFSNKLQEEYLFNSACELEYNKRLLICFLSNDKTCPILINENVILNQHEFQVNPFRKISFAKSGFKLSFYIGTRTRYYFDYYFRFNKSNECFLYRSESSSYDIQLSGSNKSQTRSYNLSKKTNLKCINIRNFVNYY